MNRLVPVRVKARIGIMDRWRSADDSAGPVVRWGSSWLVAGGMSMWPPGPGLRAGGRPATRSQGRPGCWGRRLPRWVGEVALFGARWGEVVSTSSLEVYSSSTSSTSSYQPSALWAASLLSCARTPVKLCLL